MRQLDEDERTWMERAYWNSVKIIDEGYEILAQWEGHITIIEDDHFWARMNGIFGEGVKGEMEDAEIPFTSKVIDPCEIPNLCLGRLFLLTIYRLSNDEEKTELEWCKATYTQEEIDESHKRAEALHKGMVIK